MFEEANVMENKNNYAVLILNVTRVPFPNEDKSEIDRVAGEFNRGLYRMAERGGFLFDTEEEAKSFDTEITEFAKTLYENKRKDKT